MNQKKKPFNWKGELSWCWGKIALCNVHAHDSAHGCMHEDVAACSYMVVWKDVGLSGRLLRDPDVTCILILCFGTGNSRLPDQDILMLHLPELPHLRFPQ